jgi:hypothetical protein
MNASTEGRRIDSGPYGSGLCVRATHGRADALQNYHPKAPNPILNIDYQSKKTWSYTRLSDLLLLNRVAVSVPDPKINKTDLYEGTALTQIVPDISHYRVDVFRASSFRQIGRFECRS